MKYKAQDLIDAINNANITEEQKRKIFANLKGSGKINDGLYLKKDNEGNIECWYINKDENNVIDQGPTDYDLDQVVNELVSSLEEQPTHKM